MKAATQQEDEREDEAEGLELRQLVVERPGRELQRSRMAPRPPYGSSSRSSPAIDVVRRRAARQRQRHVVEAALHVEGARQRPALHPEDAEAAVVGHELARPDAVDVLRRQRDADDGQRAPPAVDDRRDAVAGTEAVRLDEDLAGQHFVGPRRVDPAPRRKEHVVERRLAAIGGIEISRPVAGSSSPGTSSVTSATTRVSTRDHARECGDAVAASRSGARSSEANTSAKRCRS